MRLRRPGRSRREDEKQRWMQLFEARALELGGPPGRLDWQTATFLYNEGVGPYQAAERMYVKGEKA